MKILDIFETVNPVVPFWVKVWLFVFQILHPIEGKKLVKELMRQREEIIAQQKETLEKADEIIQTANEKLRLMKEGA